MYFEGFVNYKLAVRGRLGYGSTRKELQQAFLLQNQNRRALKQQLFQESPGDWEKVHASFLGKQIPMNTGWVHDLLDGKKTKDVVMFNDLDADKGFYLLGDHHSKKCVLAPHDLTDILAIPVRKDLRCLRDLRAKHIPLLSAILKRGTQIILDASPEVESPREIQAFIHYPPTTYHLHIHFTHTKNPSTQKHRVGKAHLLEEVIQNLIMSDSYYQEKTLFMLLDEEHEIYKYHQLRPGKA